MDSRIVVVVWLGPGQALMPEVVRNACSYLEETLPSNFEFCVDDTAEREDLMGRICENRESGMYRYQQILPFCNVGSCGALVLAKSAMRAPSGHRAGIPADKPHPPRTLGRPAPEHLHRPGFKRRYFC